VIGDEDEVSENNTLVFRLQVECTPNPHPVDPSGRDKYIHSEGMFSIYGSGFVLIELCFSVLS
jgi:hypothetical protein